MFVPTADILWPESVTCPRIRGICCSVLLSTAGIRRRKAKRRRRGWFRIHAKLVSQAKTGLLQVRPVLLSAITVSVPEVSVVHDRVMYEMPLHSTVVLVIRQVATVLVSDFCLQFPSGSKPGSKPTRDKKYRCGSTAQFLNSGATGNQDAVFAHLPVFESAVATIQVEPFVRLFGPQVPSILRFYQPDTQKCGR